MSSRETMDLNHIIGRNLAPRPWAEGENIPWNDPSFSERMLKEHLNQEHDLASRRFELIDRHVAWIHEKLLERKPAKILELTCGPGLYTSRLARMGHECVGIDYAPASIRYAEEIARAEGLPCTYKLEDVRKAEYGEGYGMVLMNNGQFNVFRGEEARLILCKAQSALLPGGLLLLEPQTYEAVERLGKRGTSWYACGVGGGLFLDRPHLCLEEAFWNPDAQATIQRFFIVDSETSGVTRHAMTTEAYTEKGLRDVIARAGFVDIRFFPSLLGVDVEGGDRSDYLVTVARRNPDRSVHEKRDEA